MNDRFEALSFPPLKYIARKDLGLSVLKEPNRDENYLNLAERPENVLDASLRADLIVRWMVIRGFRETDLQRMSSITDIYRTRHYLTMMTAAREYRGVFAQYVHFYERRIVETPPVPGRLRKVALQNLLSCDDVSSQRAQILVAAMPKSASTFLCTLTAELIDRPMTTPHNRNDPVGVAFDQLAFMRAYSNGGVIHSHLDANDRTLAMIRLLDLKPIVQIRNIFDALASYVDHSARRRYPGSRFAALSASEARRVSILRIARHYVDLVASWSMAPVDVPLLWVDYSEVRSDPVATIRRVFEHVGLTVDDARIDAAVQAADPSYLSRNDRIRLRINKAIPDRGAMFTLEEKAWVRTLYAEYPQVDFSRIDPGVA